MSIKHVSFFFVLTLCFLHSRIALTQDCDPDNVRCRTKGVCFNTKTADYGTVEFGDILNLTVTPDCCEGVHGSVTAASEISWNGAGNFFTAKTAEHGSGVHEGQVAGDMIDCNVGGQKSPNWTVNTPVEVLDCNISVSVEGKEAVATMKNENGEGVEGCPVKFSASPESAVDFPNGDTATTDGNGEARVSIEPDPTCETVTISATQQSGSQDKCQCGTAKTEFSVCETVTKKKEIDFKDPLQDDPQQINKNPDDVIAKIESKIKFCGVKGSTVRLITKVKQEIAGGRVVNSCFQSGTFSKTLKPSNNPDTAILRKEIGELSDEEIKGSVILTAKGGQDCDKAQLIPDPCLPTNENTPESFEQFNKQGRWVCINWKITPSFNDNGCFTGDVILNMSQGGCSGTNPNEIQNNRTCESP